MSTRYGPDSHTRIWEHLNDLDQDRLDLVSDVDGIDDRVTALESGSESDTGRVAFSVSSPAGAGWYRRVGNLVEVYIATSASVSSSTSFTTSAVIPADSRPSPAVALACGGGVSGDREANGVINADGTITIRNNFSSATAVQGYGMYRIAP